MEKKLLVSVIMPAYNAESFIKESVESVINQSYKNWELIIINDASTDKTRTVLEDVIKKEKRIKLINLDSNKGIVNARNKALSIASGQFIAFLDSDDLWYAQKLEKQLKFMVKNNSGISYTAYDMITQEGELIKTLQVPIKLTYTEALKGNSMACLSVMINKNITGNVKMPDIRHEDYATWLNIIKEVKLARGFNEVLGKYRLVKKSVSSNKFKMIKWSWDIYYKNQNLGLLKSMYYTGIHLIKGFIKHYI